MNKPKKRISVQAAKAKGRNLQKYVRDKILEKFPQLTDLDCRSTSMGAGGADVQLSTAAKQLFNYEIECKSLAKVAVYKFYEQAKTHGNSEAIVFVKQNGSKPLVIVDADYFFKELL